MDGDIEKPDLGIDPRRAGAAAPDPHARDPLRGQRLLRRHLRELVPRERARLPQRARLLACRAARAGLRRSSGHVAIETSYIHGRKRRSIAQENALVFPRHFYNNFYELTKAMASIETDRLLVDEGLRVTQLLPSIVIGDSRTGNNRGDTKVVNAPSTPSAAPRKRRRGRGRPGDNLRARAMAMVRLGFPGDETAELNLVPVDRVVAGILAALTVPEAIGNRIHLATDNRIRSEDMIRITREELGAACGCATPRSIATSPCRW